MQLLATQFDPVSEFTNFVNQPYVNLLDGQELPAKAPGELAPGQRLRIETPGGGGYGRSR